MDSSLLVFQLTEQHVGFERGLGHYDSYGHPRVALDDRRPTTRGGTTVLSMQQKQKLTSPFEYVSFLRLFGGHV